MSPRTVNHTPFPSLCFVSRDVRGDEIATLVVSGTFRIVDGEPLIPAKEQLPVATRAAHVDGPGSSMLADADLAPFKPAADVHIHAVARAPGGRPARGWPLRLRVGSVCKDYRVVGPCLWQHSRLGGWQRGRPLPCREVPLTYERAFGGRFGARADDVDPRNPLGTGCIRRSTPTDRDIPGAQLLSADDPDPVPGSSLVPRGCQPLVPSWQPRLSHAGSFDEDWRRKRWPLLPESFDYRFYNSAHRDLIHREHFRGGEPIELVNVTNEGLLRSWLPRYRLWALVRRESGALHPLPLALDTVWLDVADPEPEHHRARLSWRGVLRNPATARVIEPRLSSPLPAA